MRKKYVWGNSGSKLNSSLTYLECLWWLQNKKIQRNATPNYQGECLGLPVTSVLDPWHWVIMHDNCFRKRWLFLKLCFFIQDEQKLILTAASIDQRANCAFDSS